MFDNTVIELLITAYFSYTFIILCIKLSTFLSGWLMQGAYYVLVSKLNTVKDITYFRPKIRS